MIRKAQTEDADSIAGLAIQMWRDHDLQELANEFRESINAEGSACFIKYVDEKPET